MILHLECVMQFSSFSCKDRAISSTPAQFLSIPGTESTAPDFIVSGTATEQLMGVAESFWREGMGPEELAEVLGQSLLSGIDRDCLSGWGGMVYILTDKELITKTLKGRMD
ncbi:proteasome subunit beta type, putative [Perkinsus marinus ATCC 50983]|uniref:Proteasome subunit beta type, putative n=1 Tax=Perkinsus marinus (strain ATCC 50983 / TXsc) TaxID=423536 RepID=C5LF74_PERM5|nr:proteasome subunit beta type, putative [Perkinsus marinus ATCC 50983]EER04589.1 proteasome subunit beta type, putative [Perkinsus marinus ATCC 50983]|eukprot:XP_002772773.1 proteasome subunit beta type, putative [Perkinsus marinus ATCC 50983]